MAAAPNEYGFYANVNPEVSHPRWSQATERRIGDFAGRRKTLPFNGYAEQVAHLYEGMNIAVCCSNFHCERWLSTAKRSIVRPGVPGQGNQGVWQSRVTWR